METRGIGVVVISEEGQVEEVAVFDTHTSCEESDLLADFIASQRKESIIVAVVKDEASERYCLTYPKLQIRVINTKIQKYTIFLINTKIQQKKRKQPNQPNPTKLSLTENAKAAFELIGSLRIRELGFRFSWALISSGIEGPIEEFRFPKEGAASNLKRSLEINEIPKFDFLRPSSGPFHFSLPFFIGKYYIYGSNR